MFFITLLFSLFLSLYLSFPLSLRLSLCLSPSLSVSRYTYLIVRAFLCFLLNNSLFHFILILVLLLLFIFFLLFLLLFPCTCLSLSLPVLLSPYLISPSLPPSLFFFVFLCFPVLSFCFSSSLSFPFSFSFFFSLSLSLSLSMCLAPPESPQRTACSEFASEPSFCAFQLSLSIFTCSPSSLQHHAQRASLSSSSTMEAPLKFALTTPALRRH